MLTMTGFVHGAPGSRHATPELLQIPGSVLKVAVSPVPLLPTSSPPEHPWVPLHFIDLSEWSTRPPIRDLAHRKSDADRGQQRPPPTTQDPTAPPSPSSPLIMVRLEAADRLRPRREHPQPAPRPCPSRRRNLIPPATPGGSARGRPAEAADNRHPAHAVRSATRRSIRPSADATTARPRTAAPSRLAAEGPPVERPEPAPTPTGLEAIVGKGAASGIRPRTSVVVGDPRLEREPRHHRPHRRPAARPSATRRPSHPLQLAPARYAEPCLCLAFATQSSSTINPTEPDRMGSRSPGAPPRAAQRPRAHIARLTMRYAKFGAALSSVFATGFQAAAHLLRAEEGIRQRDPVAARAAMEQIQALQDEHGLETPPESHYRHATPSNRAAPSTNGKHRSASCGAPCVGRSLTRMFALRHS